MADGFGVAEIGIQPEAIRIYIVGEGVENKGSYSI